MAVEVRQPQKKDTFGRVMSLANLGISGAQLASGNPAGAVGVAQGINQMAGPDAQPSAMERRLGSPPMAPQVDDPLKALEDARVALATQPPEIQQQYGAPIQAAWLQARRQQGVV